MNGWDEGHPAWWLNLEAHPDAVVRLAHQQPAPSARTPSPPERNVNGCGSAGLEIEPEVDAFASRRSTETPVVVLEPTT